MFVRKPHHPAPGPITATKTSPSPKNTNKAATRPRASRCGPLTLQHVPESPKKTPTPNLFDHPSSSAQHSQRRLAQATTTAHRSPNLPPAPHRNRHQQRPGTPHIPILCNSAARPERHPSRTTRWVTLTISHQPLQHLLLRLHFAHCDKR